LGDGTASGPFVIPIEVNGGATDWSVVSAGGGPSCARITSGRLFCWGSRFHFELGDGTDSDALFQDRPIAVTR
jgi:hypothetical protein